MKRNVLFGLVIVLALVAAGLYVGSAVPFVASADDPGVDPGGIVGGGTQSDPYLIATVEDYLRLSEAYDGTYAEYRLTADLDFGGQTVEPWGSSEVPFFGKFDGDHHRIFNATVRSSSGGATGLFGMLFNASVIDLGVYDVVVDGTGAPAVGGIVGVAENTSVTGSYVGGIAGVAENASVTGSYFNGSIRVDASSGATSVGGLIGSLKKGSVSRSFASADITVVSGADSVTAGGLIGVADGTADSGADDLSVVESYAAVRTIGGTPALSGGLIGAKTGQDTLTLSYAYFNSDFVSTALGNPEDTTVIANNVVGYSAAEWATVSVTTVFPFSTEIWAPDKSRSGDAAAVFYPELAGFRQRSPYFSKYAASTRFYGFLPESGSAEWGTQDNPYLIETPAQFLYLSTAVNTYRMTGAVTYSGKFFRLASDLDMSDVSGFQPIGSGGSQVFRGNFDGDDHTISGLVVDRSRDVVADLSEGYNTGVFGLTDGAVIQNVNFGNLTVKGTETVGAVVGKATGGKIAGITVDGVVEGIRFVGGIAGSLANVTCSDLLSTVRLEGTSGLSGIAAQTSASSAANCWFVTDQGSADAVGTVTFGSMMVEGQNGEVVATRTGSTVQFTASAESGVWRPQFRTASEDVLEDSAYYTATPDSYYRGTVYARFVKSLSLADVVNGSIGFVGSAATERWFYEGQAVRLALKAEDGYYLKEAVVYNTVNNPMTASFEYEFSSSDRSNIAVVAMPGADADRFGAEFVAVNAPAIDTREYDGTPTTYSFELPDVGFTTEIIYSSNNPTAAGTYSLTVWVADENGVRRGSQSLSFTIAKRRLTVIRSLLPNEKPYDGKLTYEPITVPVGTEAFAGIVPSDLALLGVTATVYYNKAEPSSAPLDAVASVALEFSSASSAARNYTLYDTTEEGRVYLVKDDPQSDTALEETGYISVAATITKRQITLEILPEHLNVSYIAAPVSIQQYSWQNVVAGKTPNVRFNFFRQTESGWEAVEYAINVGVYRLEVMPLDTTDIYYDIALPEEGYYLTISPISVDIRFKQYTNLVYDGAGQAILAYYNDGRSDIYLSPDRIEYSVLENGVLDENGLPVDAGRYRAVASVDGNYQGEGTIEFSVAKAEQGDLTLALADPAVELRYGMAPQQLVLTAPGSGDGQVTYYVGEGFASVDGDIATFTGGGIVVLYAVRAESKNYLEKRSADLILDVQKVNLTIKGISISAEYGSLPAIAYTFEGLVEGDLDKTVPDGFVAPSIYVENKDGSFTLYDPENSWFPVGSYLVRPEGESSANGYHVRVDYADPSAFEMNVLPKKLTVVAKNLTSVYGEAQIPSEILIYDGHFDGVPDPGALTERFVAVADPSMVGEGLLYVTAICDFGVNAGQYNIILSGYDDAVNSNFDLVAMNGVYTVTPKEVTVTLLAATKEYGQQDPVPRLTLTGLVPGDTLDDVLESAYVLRDDGSIEYPAMRRQEGENVGTYAYSSVGIVRSDCNYTIGRYFLASLQILPAAPRFGTQYELKIEYGNPLSAIEPACRVLDGVTGTFRWADPDLLPDFSKEPVLYFDAVFTPDSANYREVTVALAVEGEPRRIDVEFVGNPVITYNGREQSPLTVRIENLLEGDSVDTIGRLEYDRPVKDAGRYQARYIVTNGNYVDPDGAEITVVVQKAVLTIYLPDIEIGETETPKKDFVYEGFLGDDSAADLDELPDVIFPTKVGYYKITPFGASAKNYTIEYKESVFSILKTLLQDPTLGFVMKGDYDNRTVISVVQVSERASQKTYDAYNDAIKSMNDASLTLKKALDVYSVTVSIEGEIMPELGTGRVSIVLTEELSAERNLVIVYKNMDGKYVVAQNVKRDGVNVSFDAENMVSFALVGTPDNLWIYIAAGVGGGVALILIIAIVVIVLRKKKKKNVALGQAKSPNPSRVKKSVGKTTKSR